MLINFIAAALCTAVIAGARWCIDKIRKKSRNWSATVYYWIWIGFLVLSVISWVFDNHPKYQKIRVSYTEYYAYCIKSVGNTENTLIKQSSGVDFCDCIANQMVSQEYINEHSLKAAGEVAAAVCTNKIDKILSAKGL